jgi:DNA-binding transcriptional LysR family regulator
MEFRQLHHFISLAEEMHFGRAAERSCITQPSLSASIARLEEDLGVRLFERENKRVRITPAGQLLLGTARELLAQSDHMQTYSRALAAGQAGRLEVGFTQPVLYCGVDRVIVEALQSSPGLDVIMREKVSPKQIELLRSGKLDAGLVMLPAPPAGMESILLYRDTHVVWLPASHRLAGHKVLDVGMLREEYFILPRDDNAPYLTEQVVGLCATEGFYPRILFEARSATSALHLVSRGLGISYLAQTLQNLGIPGTCFAPLRQASPRRDAYFVWNKARVAPGLQALIDIVQQFSRTLQSRRRPAW